VAPLEVDQVARGLADLRLQVNALEIVAKAASLPETVAQARRTVRWSAFVVAIALVLSSIIRYYGDRHVDAFEKRLEHLELEHDTRRP
jgi:hypothetical protein